MTPITYREILGYCIRLNELHRRLYNRLGLLVFGLAAVGLAGALVAVTHGIGERWFLVTALLLSVVGTINAVCNFGASAERYGITQRRYQRLLRKAPDLSADELERQFLDIDTTDFSYLQALRVQAFNDNLRSLGRLKEVRPLTRWQRFTVALA